MITSGVEAHGLLSRPKVHAALAQKRKAIEMTALETAVLPSWKVTRSVLTPLHD